MANVNTTRVGFIGLGIMGGAMAGNVLKAGFPLAVFNRTPEKAESLRQAGAKVAKSPADVADGSDVVLICVTDSPDVLDVVLNERHGVITGARAGLIVADHSTVAPAVARQCAAALADADAGFLDAPVSGSDLGAKAGTLSIMVGGAKEHFDKALPVFQAMGKTVTHCGGSGAGYVTKLCNQVLVAMNCLAVAEALTLAESAGVDPAMVLRAISAGAAGSWQLTNLGPKMLAGDYAPGFFVDYLLKDLRMTHQAAFEGKAPLAGAAVAETLYRAASAQGFGKLGTHSVHKLLRDLAFKPRGE